MKIAVTGASGFVGTHLVPHLAATFPEARLLPAGLEHGFDVTDKAAVLAWFHDNRPDVCVHLAGIAAIGVAKADPDRAWEVNLKGTLHVADAILAAAPSCHLLFVSSAEVYGGSFRAGLALDEAAALAPMNLYAATKAAAEMALGAMAADGLRLTRARPFNHTGPGQDEAFVVPAFAWQIARIEAGLTPPELRTGALSPERDFLDVRDVCAAYAAIIRERAALSNNSVFNIASGRAISIAAILDMLLADAGREITVVRDRTKLRPVEIARAVGDARLAAARLGWRPNFALRDTVLAVLNEARRQVGSAAAGGARTTR